MKIEKDKFVSLVYELRENSPSGKVIETVEQERPLSFVFGSGKLLPEFEENIENLSVTDSFNFVLDPERAYGERREDLIIDIPVTVFHKDGVLDENVCQVGNEVPMMDREGNHINGVINEIGDTHVKMDFNHPMAGIGLSFSGKIIEVREATESELKPHTEGCSSCSGHTHDHSHGHSCNGHCS